MTEFLKNKSRIFILNTKDVDGLKGFLKIRVKARGG